MTFRTLVHNWHYNDGWTKHYIRGKDVTEFHEELVGWHCWVYPTDNKDFDGWMENNMTGEYETIFRFNSGDPMITVFIKSDQDATLFKLKWVCEN